VGPGLGGVPQLGHADHAKDHRTGQRGPLEGDRREAREVGEQAAVLLGEAFGGVGEDEDAEHLAASGAQRLGEHAGEGRVAEALDRMASDPPPHPAGVRGGVHDLAGQRGAAGGPVEGDRDPVLAAFVPGPAAVEAVLESEALVVAHEDGPGGGAGESSGVGEDPLEQEIEVLDRGELGAGRGDRVEAGLALPHVLGEIGVEGLEAAVGLVEATVLLAHLAGHGFEFDERAAALPLGDEAGGVVVQSSLQLDGIGELHEIVARAAGERLGLGGGFLPGAQHHHRHVGEGLVGAVGLEQLEAVGIRHHEVLQDDRGMHAPCGVEGDGTLEADVQGDAVVVGEHPPHRFADHRLVVDEQDRGGGAWTGGRHDADATGGSPLLCCEAWTTPWWIPPETESGFEDRSARCHRRSRASGVSAISSRARSTRRRAW
jgi:hypothetical protein